MYQDELTYLYMDIQDELDYVYGYCFVFLDKPHLDWYHEKMMRENDRYNQLVHAYEYIGFCLGQGRYYA